MTGYPSETALHRRYREAIRLPCSLCPAWLSLYQEMAAKSPNSGQSRICCRCRRTRCLLAPNGEMRTGDRRAPRLWKTKCYLANLPVEIDLWRLAATVKARWICGQARLQLKEKLGLDPFKGLSWHGTVLARSSPSRCYDDHCSHLLAALPCCQDGAEKRIDSPPSSRSLPVRPAAIARSFFGYQVRDTHTAEDGSAKSNGVNNSAKLVLARGTFMIVQETGDLRLQHGGITRFA